MLEQDLVLEVKMGLILNFVVGMVAVLHIYFLILEMFLWTKPLGLKVFRQSLENAKGTAVLAANQGLYNGFLAAGLFWGLMEPNEEFSSQIQLFFLACVSIAGFYGGWSVNKRILYIQSLPAILGIALLLLG